MRIDIPCKHIPEIRDLFYHIGHPVRFVGGCVRDAIAGQPIKDIDLATPALPEDVMHVAEGLGYRVIPTGLQHGTVTVVMDGEPYEITTLRADVETDGRHATVKFVTDFETDAARRDFTFNAMSADLDGNVFDYFGGIVDLLKNRVTFVGDLNARITEDYLRILRFYRFQTRYGGKEADGLEQLIGLHADGLTKISGERVWSEMARIISAPNAFNAIWSMSRTGILDVIGLETRSEGHYQIALQNNPKFPIKPALMLGILAKDQEAVAAVADRWRISTEDRQAAMLACDVYSLIMDAKRDINPDVRNWHYWTNKAILGSDLEDIKSVLRQAGFASVAEAMPATLPEFPLKGRDLMEVGIQPGKEMGAMLGRLKETWMDSQYTLSKEDLLVSAGLGTSTASYSMKP
jgi:tRNA nucleotidyltransferase/poly(A) polymerase